MIQLVYRNKRGGSTVRAVKDSASACALIEKLYNQGIKKLVAREKGEEVGRIWIDDYGKRNWYCFK